MTSAVDLSKLPAPDVVESLDFEVILRNLKADLLARDATFEALEFESDPVVKLLEVVAYREVMLRQRVNDAARGVMLAFSTGSDLDQIAANIGVKRLVINPGDVDALPVPIDPIYEDDESLRFRTQLAPEALSVAGSEGAYRFHAFSAGENAGNVAITSAVPGQVTLTYFYDPNGFAALVKDVSVVKTAPGAVKVTILSRARSGVPSPDLLAKVKSHISGDYVRPLTDNVTVAAAALDHYSIRAVLDLYAGPDTGVVIAAALASAQTYADYHHRLNDGVTLSGIIAALSVTGVRNVTLTQPTADIPADSAKAAHCSDFNIS